MNNSVFTIDSREISDNFPPYIIAEVSANHNGSIERANNISCSKIWSRCG